jgi:superfamily II DNA or RNA helicase
MVQVNRYRRWDMDFEKLRDYQKRSFDSLRDGIRGGYHSQVLVLPTGGGKTVVACCLLAEAHKRGTSAHFLCDRIALVDQTSKMLDFYGIPHGVIQGDHQRVRPWENIQVVSTQTATRRKGRPRKQSEMEYREPKLVIIDECHTFSTLARDYCANPDIYVIGLTATPFPEWMGDSYTNIVNAITTDALIELGWLVPVKYYAATEVNMTGVKTKRDGEWEDKGMERESLKIVGDVVEEWMHQTRTHFGKAEKSLGFSVSVAHGAELCAGFHDMGFNFQQISYKDRDDKRRRMLIEEFRKPDSEIVGLISCEALAKGFDVPDIKIGIGARPYRTSLSGVIQSAGRVMRPFPGKDYALWLDHAGNIHRFHEDMQEVYANGVHKLGAKSYDTVVRKEKTKEEKEVSQCFSCGFVTMAPICPSCGHVRPVKKSHVINVPGVSEEVAVHSSQHTKHPWMQDRRKVWGEICVHAYNLKGDHKIAENFSLSHYKQMYKEWPKNLPPYRVMATQDIVPSPEVRGMITYNMIRWHKKKKREKEQSERQGRLI